MYLMIFTLITLTIGIATCDYDLGYAGSYCGSKIYKLDLSSKDLIYRLKRIKRIKPEMEVWSKDQEGELYNLDKMSGDYYYVQHFYIPFEGDTIQAITVVDVRDNYPATLMFAKIKPPEGIAKRISELSRKERKAAIASFEEHILERCSRCFPLLP